MNYFIKILSLKHFAYKRLRIWSTFVTVISGAWPSTSMCFYIYQNINQSAAVRCQYPNSLPRHCQQRQRISELECFPKGRKRCRGKRVLADPFISKRSNYYSLEEKTKLAEELAGKRLIKSSCKELRVQQYSQHRYHPIRSGPWEN